MRGETQRQNGTREFYNDKSYGTYNINDSWGMGNLWMLFKKYGIVYDMFMVKKRLQNGQRYGFVWFKNIVNMELLFRSLSGIRIGNEYLRVYKAYDRREGENHRGNVGQKTEYQRKDTRSVRQVPINERDNRRYSDVVGGLKKGVNNGDDVEHMGMKEPGNGDYKSEMNKGGSGVKAKVVDDVRTIEVMDSEIDKETLCRGIIGEVKMLEYLDRLPGLCGIEGLYNVAVKHLGGLKVMIIVDTVETVNNVLRNIEHGIRRWMRKMRKWDDQCRPSGRLTLLDIMGVPIACWNETTFGKIAALHGSIIETNNCCLEGHQSVAIGRVMIHTITPDIIKEVVHIKVKKRTYKVGVVEEISNVVEIEEIQKVTEEDEEEHQPENGENNMVAMDQEAYTEGGGDGEEDDEHRQAAAGKESRKSNLEDREEQYERRSMEFEFELKVDNDVTLNEGSLAAKVGSDVSKKHGEENEEVIACEKS
ncbi:hypothetical protein CTI12_AA301900 [Artemisia annua]|uniref:RRM domain-containing protein n=1 Tax=Artemisia annua TaxID=35608 RepID=A0A2U1N4S2_ARTAN|nr:hypothetical protein CTI12_AA301900 [Artemisia annua]